MKNRFDTYLCKLSVNMVRIIRIMTENIIARRGVSKEKKIITIFKIKFKYFR